jgi:hypothetical protein
VAIALDGAEISFATADDAGTVHRCPVTGCPDAGAPPTVIDKRGPILALGAFAGELFWTEIGSKSIQRCTSTNCAASLVAMSGVVDVQANDLDVDGTYAYATDTGSQKMLRCSHLVAVACGVLTNSSGGQPQRVAAQSGTLFYSGAGGEVRSWGTNFSSGLDLINGAGRVPGVKGLAVVPAGDAVVFVNQAQNQVLSVPNVAQSQLVALTTTPAPDRIAVDETRIYWTTNAAIMWCPRTGCSVGASLLAAATKPTALRIDASFVYWAAADGVFRMAKP